MNCQGGARTLYSLICTRHVNTEFLTAVGIVFSTCWQFCWKCLTPSLAENVYPICASLATFLWKERLQLKFLMRLKSYRGIAHYMLETSETKGLYWRYSLSFFAKKFKTMSSAKKVVASIFWLLNGIILIEYLSQREAISAVRYYENLKKCTKRKPGFF